MLARAGEIIWQQQMIHSKLPFSEQEWAKSRKVTMDGGDSQDDNP
jgi:hypothetical protein